MNRNHYYDTANKNNRFYDKTGSRTSLGDIQYHRKYLKRKRFLKFLLADMLFVLAGLLIFAFFHIAAQNKFASAPVALAQPKDSININSVSGPYATAENPSETEPGIAAVSSPAPTPQPMLNPAFSDKFTNGEIIATENSYQSSDICFAIDKKQKGDVVYYVADIYLKDISSFKTAFAKDQYGDSISDSIQNIAGQNNALLALTGDYYSVHSDGVVIRNGVLYRDTLWRDVLIMYSDGSMETYSKSEFDINDAISKGAYQGWSFSPMLLKDGLAMTEFESNVKTRNPRSAIGYYEPGHYAFVTVDGRGQSGSPGMTMKELSQLFYDLGCSAAYNLDGGGSAKMMYMDGMVNHPSSRSREISDILMIVEPDGENP